MEKITKKRFREIIENKVTANIGRLPIERFPLDKVDEFVTDERVASIEAPFWRTVEVKQSNLIMFSDKAWVEFKAGGAVLSARQAAVPAHPELADGCLSRCLRGWRIRATH